MAEERLSGSKDVAKSKVSLISVIGMFYAICCAGAYGVEEMIPECGAGMTIIMLIALPIFWALPYGLICADMGAARPVEGGSLIWVKEALGEFWFSVMVLCNILWALLCNTVYVVLAVSYFGKLVELTAFESYALKVLMVLIFFLINALGLKEVGGVSTILSILIFIAFALVAVVGFMNMNSNPMSPMLPEDTSALEGIGAGLAIGVWMYSGLDEISIFGGEIEDAGRKIPKALLIVIPLMALTYILPTLGGLGSIGQWEDWTTDPTGVGYSEVLTTYAGPALGVMFLIVAIIGQCSIFNVCLATGSRTMMILSEEKLGPACLANLTKNRRIPLIALVIVCVVTLALIPFDFTILVVVEVFFMVFVTALTVISCIVLRRKLPEEDIKFKIPGGNTTHLILGIMVLAICVANTLLNGTDWYLGGLVWVLVVPILYIVLKKIFGGPAANDPGKYPVNPKTGLGYGDLSRIGYFYGGIGIFSILARFFLQWYEGDWGPDYYIETYESGLFSDFDLMLTVITIVAICSLVVGIIFKLASKKLDY